MAENKKSFVFYCDWADTFKSLPKEDGYDLLMHLLSYVNDEDPQSDSVLVNAVFQNIKNTLKRDLAMYEHRADRSRQNGKKGGRPKNPTEPKEPTGLINNPTEPRKPDSVSVSVSDSVSVTSKDINSNKLLCVFNSILGKKARVIPAKAEKQIKDRLKEGYSKEDIVLAMENAAKDQHHMDSNYKYLTLEFITRPDKLERFVNMSNFKVKTKIL
jgi:hypothetical protein|tara:strand:- start:3311 stop:3952 length:642 start_codon:yes stop_codon:yes gene_type:complete